VSRVKLRLADVERVRWGGGGSVLLFITDRCPVGCAHCSVDSRAAGRTIRDLDLFASIVDAISAMPEVEVAGISGGEPFAERRGLVLATERLVAAGKQVVVYTSGAWAAGAVPAWIRRVLRASACVFLSTDAFHRDRLPDRRFALAARAVVTEGAGLVVQVLDRPGEAERAERMLASALGPGWAEAAELSRTPPLPYGRGAALFGSGRGRPASSFGRCRLLAAPVVRYDGLVSACCNERVLMGAGPDRLRRRCASGGDVTAAVAGLRADPLLAAVGAVGPGPLTAIPAFADLAGAACSNICDACWALASREPAAEPVPLLRALAAVPTGRERP
jgi:hypothetical protein